MRIKKFVLSAILLVVIISYNNFVLAEEIFVEGDSISIKLSFAGDCTLGTDLKYGWGGSFMETYENQSDPDSYFFANVRSIFEADDLTVVNLEGPLTSSNNVANKEFAFKGLPKYTGILNEGSVEVVNLANNHTRDYGEAGYNETIANLNNAGVASYGIDKPYVTEVKGIKVGFLGYTSWSADSGVKNKIAKDITNLKNQGVTLIITSFHGGVERANYPNSQQKTLARHAIDNGADLVVQHHPHVIQGIEIYSGKYIVYSLGNFSFGGNRNPIDKDTFIFQQIFEFDKDTMEMTNSNALIYPCSISSVTNRNNFQPTLLTGGNADRLMGRIAEYSYALNGNRDVVTGLNANHQPVVPAFAKFKKVETPIILFENNPIELDLPVLARDGVTYVPVQQLLERLNATVKWDEETKKIRAVLTADSGDTLSYAASFTIGVASYDKYLVRTLDREEPIPVSAIENVEMDVAPFIYEGIAYVPLRYAAESLNYTVSWDSETKGITIDRRP